MSAAVANWFVEKHLLDSKEAARWTDSLRLPETFAARVLTLYGPAGSVTSRHGITSKLIIQAEPKESVGAPRLTNCSEYPNGFLAVARHLPAQLHESEVGKIYVGSHRTTLMLEENCYFHSVSQPTSSWITPAFYDAPGELRLPGVVAILNTNGAHMFSHWMFDLLPKAEILRRAGWSVDSVDYYVVNRFDGNFRKEAFARLGIPEKKVVTADECVIRADRLLVPSQIRLRFKTPQWVREFIRRLYFPTEAPFGSGEVGLPLRLYISRDKGRRRRIINEAEVRGVLERDGFQTVFPEEVPVNQFAELIARSERIVAPHGAGVTNVVFASTCVRLLEIYAAHLVPEGWLMTSGVGGRYYLMAGKDNGGRYPWEDGAYRGLSHGRRNAADFLVDASDLKRAIAMMSEP